MSAAAKVANGAHANGSVHHYPRAAWLMDALCGVTGLLVCVVLITVVVPVGWFAYMLIACALLFTFYLLTVITRCQSRIEMDANSLRVFATTKSRRVRRCITWSALELLELDYFCTRRDGRSGWLQLRLRSGACTVRLDSRLHGFERILARAVAAARTCGVELGAATASNLVAIGAEDGGIAGGSGHSDGGRADRLCDGRAGIHTENMSNDEMNVRTPSRGR
jgi:hypothetical protein